MILMQIYATLPYSHWMILLMLKDRFLNYTQEALRRLSNEKDKTKAYSEYIESAMVKARDDIIKKYVILIETMIIVFIFL